MSAVYIEGKIKNRKWEDKEGNTRYNTEILGDNMTMLGGKPLQESGTVNSEIESSSDKADDLPF